MEQQNIFDAITMDDVSEIDAMAAQRGSSKIEFMTANAFALNWFVCDWMRERWEKAYREGSYLEVETEYVPGVGRYVLGLNVVNGNV